MNATNSFSPMHFLTAKLTQPNNNVWETFGFWVWVRVRVNPHTIHFVFTAVIVTIVFVIVQIMWVSSTSSSTFNGWLWAGVCACVCPFSPKSLHAASILHNAILIKWGGQNEFKCLFIVKCQHTTWLSKYKSHSTEIRIEPKIERWNWT